MELLQAGHYATRRPVVVIVDDETEVLASLRRTLRREPYLVLSTADPLEALSWVRKVPVDLVLTDLRMSGMMGAQLIESVRTASPGVACLLLSGHPEDERINERFIPKPWDDGDLRRAIARSLWERVAAPGARPRDLVEARIDCKGRTADGVLAELLPFLERARNRRSGVDLVLVDLPQLNDSLARLLKGMVRRVVRCDVPARVSDASGCAAALIGELGNPVLPHR